jgi:flagellar biosynthesis protein FlhF
MPVSAKGNNSEFLARLKTVSAQNLDDSQEETPKRNAVNADTELQNIKPARNTAQSSEQNSRKYTLQKSESKNESEKPIQIMKIHDDLNDMKKLLAQILATGESKASGGYAGPWAILYKRLIDSEIRDDFAKELIDKLKKSAPNPGKEITKAFLQELADCFTVSACETARIQFFVGPTGAGKTTTIAKLAAYFSLEKKLRCSLITTDTYRISAIDQLRAYSEIIGIDLQAIYSPDEIGDMIENCKYSDVILVDSAGRSQKNREHMDELAAFIRELQPDCTHLVLSAATKESDLIETANRYRKLGLSRLLFTKLDETMKLGNIFNAVQATGIPVSYFTTGQSVPDDIETAKSMAFVKKLLEGSSL